MPKPILDAEARMTLLEHLTELRSRLARCAMAVFVLGVASLVFAKPIFGILMKPAPSPLKVDAGIERIKLSKLQLLLPVQVSTVITSLRSNAPLWRLGERLERGAGE